MERFGSERTATLQRKRGEIFGFKLRCAAEDGAQFRLVEGLPTLHALIDVAKDGHAYKASFREEDLLVEINGQDVRSKSYKECARLLISTGERLLLKVIRRSEENTVDPPVSPPVELQFEDEILTNHIPDFLKPNRCVYTIKAAFNDPSIIQSFEILKPHCATPEGPLHPTFNTIVDRPLDGNILANILSDPTSAAIGLTPYVVDSLKRFHSLHDIIILLPEVLDIHSDSKYETLVDQLSKRMLLVQALETLSYDSQRFLCNFIRKNDLPIPLSYRIWNATEKVMSYRINFNCLMETLCVTDLHLLLQFGSPSASGLGKSSLIGYFFDDKRRESFFTEASDCSWRDGCVDVLFAGRYAVFDVHGKTTDMKLIRAIQPYSSVQLIYLTEEDLQGDFLETNVLPNTQTIAVVFDSNYDDPAASTEVLKRFEERFKLLTNVLWSSAPMLNAHTNLPARKITQRNKRLRETFDQLLKEVQSKAERSVFRSCFQIQSSFYQRNSSPTPIELIFAVERELDRLFSPLSDRTANLLLVTPVSHQRSFGLTLSEKALFNSDAVRDFSRSIQAPSIVNAYHTFTISLLNHRTYIELLITEIFLEKWRAAYMPNLRKEQEDLREQASALLRQLKQAERENCTSPETSALRQQYEQLRARLREVDNRMMNVDLTVGLLCDELFALWDNIHVTQPAKSIELLQSTFDLVAKKLAKLVYKGFALHVLRSRPLQSHSRLLRMCMGQLELGNSVAVLTVIGEQSSAKSSLLNSTFGCNFRVSAGRCTIGLYLGIAYYKNTTIMILDTEGLMSLEESGSIFDNQMVTMAVLSSNLVIVNHKGEISSSLEGLIGMSLYAKIQIQSSPFKPKLLFVLRDQTQRDMKIFQQQLNRLKENIQNNGEFLQVSIDDELEMKHVVLMPGAFTEDTNRDYGIVQKWRTETFAVEINRLRNTVFESLEAQMSESVNSVTVRKNFDAYFYLKLTTNWKSIDDLGEGLLRCQSLYELSVQNELKNVSGTIIAERHNSLQKRGSESIETLVRTTNEQMYTHLETSDGLKPHDWIQHTMARGMNSLMELINEDIEVAQSAYDEQAQRSCFAKVKSQWKNIESSIRNMQQYLYEQLEMRTLETALQTNRDYYKRELFVTKEAGRASKESIEHLNHRVKQLESEITDNLEPYKRNKHDLIKSILDVYKNVIETKNSDAHRRSTYNLCPLLDYPKYWETARKLGQVIDKFVKPFLQLSGMDQASPSNTQIISPLSVPKQDDRSVLQWFTNADDPHKNERTLHFVFSELLPQISNRLDISPLHLAYSDPKMMDELIEIIDYELHSTKLDMSHMNRPSLVRDLIIFTLHLLLEKTNQRFESKYQQLLNDTLNALHQVAQNVREQIEEEETSENQGKIFRRILGKEIIREVERINRQKLIAEIHGKLNEKFILDSTEVTRHIYAESIASETIDPTAILKLVYDPTHFCFEEIYSNVQELGRQFIQIYADDTNTTVSICMLTIRDVVADDECVDAHVLHKLILQQIVSILPNFQASRVIEVEQKIANPKRFQDYFKSVQLFDGESDAVLTEQLAKAHESFRRIVLSEHLDTLIYRSIGCQARCPGCGMKCELPAKSDPSEVHHHSSQYHLPMAFHGWPRNKDLHPNLSMCYQQWTKKILFRDEDFFSTPEEFFSLEAPNWFDDLREKSERGEAHAELYPLVEHRRAWMAVRSKLLQEFDLRDQESYHSGVYPTTIVSIPNDFALLWKSL